MKKKVKMALFAMMLAAAMSGCGKKKDEVKDDFVDVQGTTATNTNASTENGEALNASTEDESANLPVDATISYGDNKTVDIYYDLQAWPSDIAGPISATAKEIDETYLQNFVNKLFDDGQYKNLTPGASGNLLVETKVEQGGTVSEAYLGCELEGKVDGADMSLYFNKQTAGEMISAPMLSICKTNFEGWASLDEEMLEGLGPNVYDEDEAILKAEEYLAKWGLDDFCCVGCDDITTDFGEDYKPNGYNIMFRKKIGTSLGAPYNANCFYNPDNASPSFFDSVTMIITSEGLLNVDIVDMYELGTDKQTATIMDKDAAIEKGTEAIKDYFDRKPDNYIIYSFENKSVWSVDVDLAYVPIVIGEEVSYRALYVFSTRDEGFSVKTPFVAIDAYDGTAYDVDYMYYGDNAGSPMG